MSGKSISLMTISAFACFLLLAMIAQPVSTGSANVVCSLDKSVISPGISTTLTYTLGNVVNANTTIMVWDPSENPVWSKLEGDQGPGIHQVSWDGTFDNGTAVPGGQYTITVTVVNDTYYGLNDPQCVAVNNSGYVYLTDSNSGAGLVYVFAPDGTLLTQILGLQGPKGIAVNNTGYVYVADNTAGVVDVYAPDNTLAMQLTLGYSPSGIAVNQSGYAYVTELLTPSVHILRPDGTELTRLTVFDPYAPIAVAFNNSGYVFVAVANFVSQSGEVYVYGPGDNMPSGTLMGQIMDYKPQGIFVDSFGLVYVTTSTGFVDIYSLEGTTPVNILSGFGFPQGIAQDTNGNLYVVDNGWNALTEIFNGVGGRAEVVVNDLSPSVSGSPTPSNPPPIPTFEPAAGPTSTPTPTPTPIPPPIVLPPTVTHTSNDNVSAIDITLDPANLINGYNVGNTVNHTFTINGTGNTSITMIVNGNVVDDNGQRALNNTTITLLIPSEAGHNTTVTQSFLYPGNVSVPLDINFTVTDTMTGPQQSAVAQTLATMDTLVALFTSQLPNGSSGGTVTSAPPTAPPAPQTIAATNSGGSLFSVITPGSSVSRGTGSGTGSGDLTGPAQSGSSGAGGPSGTSPTPPADSSDRALAVVAIPPLVPGASQLTSRTPQLTTQISQGISQMMVGGLCPPGGSVPGIGGGFSSSGNSGRWQIELSQWSLGLFLQAINTVPTPAPQANNTTYQYFAIFGYNNTDSTASLLNTSVTRDPVDPSYVTISTPDMAYYDAYIFTELQHATPGDSAAVGNSGLFGDQPVLFGLTWVSLGVILLALLIVLSAAVGILMVTSRSGKMKK